MGKMKGRKAHISRLRKMAGSDFERTVGKALFAGGEAIQVEAQISITTGAVSGKQHVASAPGEAPNADTHFLANQIETHQIKPLRVRVVSNAEYSEALEHGTSRMAARPFLGPARDTMKEEVLRLIREAKRAVQRRAKSGD